MNKCLVRFFSLLLVMPLWTGCHKPAQAATPSPEPAALEPSKSAAREIAELKAELKSSPEPAKIELLLALAHLRNLTQNGIATDCTEVEKHALRAASLSSNRPAVTGLRPLIATCKYDFEEAIRLATAASKEGPDHWSYSLIVIDGQLEQGQYDAAEQTLQALAPHADELPVQLRTAKLKELRGDLDGAAMIMRSVTDSVAGAPIKSFEKAWMMVNAAELDLRRGDLKSAEAYIDRAREFDPAFYQINLSLAALRRAQRRPEEAAALLEKAVQVRPWPENYFDLGDIYLSLGKTKMAEEAFRKGIGLAKQPGLPSKLHARRLANFYLSHDRNPAEALALLKSDNRSDVTGLQIRAYALLKNSRKAEALVEIEKALSVGTRSPQLFYRAGTIYKANGNSEKAREYFNKALGTAAYFNEEMDTRVQLTILDGEKWQTERRATR